MIFIAKRSINSICGKKTFNYIQCVIQDIHNESNSRAIRVGKSHGHERSFQ